MTAAVVVRDRRELMAWCLDGLLHQVGIDYEVVIVDNGSTDGTAEMVATRASTADTPVTLIVDDGSLGRIRNRAVSVARVPIVAFVDSDCVPEPGWLAAGVLALEAHPRVGVVQGRTVPDPDVPRDWWPATQDIDAFTHRYEACNIFYRRDALVAAGGFDEEIGAFGEDMAAGWAVRRLGWDGVFGRDAVVTHAVSHPGLAWHLRRAQQYAAFNVLARRFPEVRSLFWHRWFLRPSDCALTVALAGTALAAGTRRAGPLVLAAPYVWMRRPKGRRRQDIVAAGSVVAFDAAILAGLARGSVRTGAIVL